ncbi:MAG: cytochrome c oxidase accessory protein CcoG [Bacteroidota bacterium]
MSDYHPYDKFYQDEEVYRDKIATVDSSGKRIWIYPKKPKGRFYEYRKYVSYVLLLVLFGLPFVKVNGKPFVLLNIPETEFILFGVYFAPQDFHLFVIAMLIFMVFIVLFTVIYGRLFFGLVCPQTNFMEMVFRRIEYWIEGDANAQRRLANAPWTTDKVVKKVSKQAIFILISALIAHTFLSYIIGLDEVTKIVTEPISEHWKGFIAMIIFTGVFYGVFSVMREQVCTTICPYGRLQGVLLDENSLAVAYDFERGEPRGKLTRKKKKTEPEVALKTTAEAALIEPIKGDCIDCGLCVKVCPTGIDIRNGTQLECVNCTACMDACDEVMVKIKKPEGLIRIDSYNGIVNKKNSLWNSRVAAYTLVLVALLGLESFLFINRSSVETLFLRTPGMLYQDNDDGYISNLYNYQLINKSDLEAQVTFICEDIDGIVFQTIGQPPKTLKNQVTEGAVFIKIPKDKIKSRKTDLTIKVFKGEELLDESKTTFLGPGK